MKIRILEVLLLTTLLVSLASTFIQIPIVWAANEFSDGFESGDTSGWSANYTSGGSSVAIQSDITFRGEAALNCTSGASNTTTLYGEVRQDINASTEVYARAYYYFDTNVMPYEDNLDRLSMIQWGFASIDRVGSFQVTNDTGTMKWSAKFINGLSYVTYYNATPTVTEETWWCVEAYSLIHDTDGAVKMWVNGSLIIDQAGLNTTRYGSITKVHMGFSASIYINHNCTVYLDAARISDSYIGLEPDESTPQEFYINDDIETATFPSGNWTSLEESANCNGTRQGTTKHLGSYAAQFDIANTTTTQLNCRLYRYFTTNYTELYYRGYFYFKTGSLSQLQDVDDRIGLFMVSPNTGWDKSAVYARNISGIGVRLAVSYLTGASSSYAYSDVTPVENTWYCLESAIFVNDTVGWQKLWINGVLKVNVQGINNTRSEPYVARLRAGAYASNGGAAHNMTEFTVYADDIKVSNQYIGTDGGSNPPPIVGQWAIFSDMANEAYFTAMFDAQGIDYVLALDSDLTSLAYIQDADGLVVWYDDTPSYNVTAVQAFAASKVVICDWYDFITIYGISSSNVVTINTGATNTTETFLVDYGSKQWTNTSMFHTNDVVEWHWGNGTNSVRTLKATALSGFSNVTQIARYNSTDLTLIRMNETASAGFYVMDFYCMRSATIFNGAYQFLPAIWEAGTSTKVGMHSEWLTGASTSHLSITNMLAKWSNFVGNNTDIMNMTQIGTSVNGTDWNVTIIGFGNQYLMADAAIHGGEKTPVLGLYRFMEEVAYSYRTGGVWATRLSEVKLILLPIFNPDGYQTYGRENAEGCNLNRDLHETYYNYASSSEKTAIWYGNFSQQESQNWKTVIDTYQPVLYINFHEGRDWQKNLNWDTSATGQSTISRTYSTNLQSAWDSYWYSVGHWGYYTDYGEYYRLNTVDSSDGGNMYGTAPTGYEAPYYPAHQYDACSSLQESLCWSGQYGAREQLYATDFYCSMVSQMFLRFARDKINGFITQATKPIASAAWNGVAGTYTVIFNNTGYASTGTTTVYVGARGKPLAVKIDGATQTEDVSWTWTVTTSLVTVTGSDNVTLEYTASPSDKYYFNFAFTDKDSADVESRITWQLYDNTTSPISYTEGAATLDAGTYTLNIYYLGNMIRSVGLDTSTQGNTTVSSGLFMKRLAVSSSRWVALNYTAGQTCTIVIDTFTAIEVKFTVSSYTGAANFTVYVLGNATHLQRAGVNVTGWSWDSGAYSIEWSHATPAAQWSLFFPAETPIEPPSTNAWLLLGIPMGYTAITIWSIAWVILIGFALWSKDGTMLIGAVVGGLAIEIVLFILMMILNGFSGVP